MVVQHVTVSGRNMDCGESLTQFVEDHMQTLSEKYFGKMVTCRIVFEKNPKGQNFSCNIQVVAGHDMFYAGEATAHQVHTAFNTAYEHVAKQLRRKKRKLHEDKPEGHKDDVLNELSQPEMPPPPDPQNLPIDGENLSIADQSADEGAKFVQEQYKTKE